MSSWPAGRARTISTSAASTAVYGSSASRTISDPEAGEGQVLQRKVGAALALVQVFFGIHYFVAKLLLRDVPPLAWAALRIAAAAVLLFAWNLLFVGWRPRHWGDVARLGLYAFFGIVLNQVLFVEGLARTTLSHSALLNTLIPVMTLGLAVVARRERVTARRGLGILIALASVLMLLGVEDFRLRNELLTGDLLTLANGLSYSIFLVLSRDFMRRNDPLGATAYLFLLGAAVIVPIASTSLAGAHL